MKDSTTHSGRRVRVPVVPQERTTEVLFKTEYMQWERTPTGDPELWVNLLKLPERWIFLVCDEQGKNRGNQLDPQTVYELISDAYPIVLLMGNRHDGFIEILNSPELTIII